MASWLDIVAAFWRLNDTVAAGEAAHDAWSRFRDAAIATMRTPPNHMRTLFDQIEKTRHGRAIAELDILDHGCGNNGVNVLYLIALGYTGVRGVDINGSRCLRWNRVLVDCMGFHEPRFFTYDGTALPFAAESMDVVFSHTVLEHVHPEVFDSFYAEEARVLRVGGIAFHGVPHRLGPYDSHSQTWFLHWFLSRRPWVRVMWMLGRRGDVPTNHLFLRWPWVHKRAARTHFGNVEDLTMHRLMDLKTFDYFDGPIGLRRLLTRLVALPVAGRPIARIASHFLQLDTVSRKTRTAAATPPATPP